MHLCVLQEAKICWVWICSFCRSRRKQCSKMINSTTLLCICEKLNQKPCMRRVADLCAMCNVLDCIYLLLIRSLSRLFPLHHRMFHFEPCNAILSIFVVMHSWNCATQIPYSWEQIDISKCNIFFSCLLSLSFSSFASQIESNGNNL